MLRIKEKGPELSSDPGLCTGLIFYIEYSEWKEIDRHF